MRAGYRLMHTHHSLAHAEVLNLKMDALYNASNFFLERPEGVFFNSEQGRSEFVWQQSGFL
ncbi:hypothetical protein I3760_05G044500 [Carya illinoinensis]|uniref:Uncharacterized protein n=1 Tax=Carya illinoinensis TaxID=32201 RepID=A0A922EZW1_CARIL|nr:hypothetical protein I3760_05G044500 [Carya illinoinensis]KAG6711266.1 hypothetical protein I3842_05G043700 [Carya illinoinensis]